MRLGTPSARHIVATIAVALVVSWLVSAPRAQSTGQSFTTLQPDFTQELFGVTGDFDLNNSLPILGGVAFAADGDVWSSECVFLGTRLHRFDRDTFAPTANGTTLHPETIVDLTATERSSAEFGFVHRRYLLRPLGLVVTLNESPDCGDEPRTSNDGTRV